MTYEPGNRVRDRIYGTSFEDQRGTNDVERIEGTGEVHVP
jgi:hypothetical protein